MPVLHVETRVLPDGSKPGSEVRATAFDEMGFQCRTCAAPWWSLQAVARSLKLIRQSPSHRTMGQAKMLVQDLLSIVPIGTAYGVPARRPETQFPSRRT